MPVIARPAAPAASVAAASPVYIADEEIGGRALANVPDAARLFLVGTMLVALAAAVRKAG
jgi:hypothetical protein